MPLEHGYGVLNGTLLAHERDRPDNQGRWYHVKLTVDVAGATYSVAVDVDSHQSATGVQWKVVPASATDLGAPASLGTGWHPLASTPTSGALDHIRHPIARIYRFTRPAVAQRGVFLLAEVAFVLIGFATGIVQFSTTAKDNRFGLIGGSGVAAAPGPVRRTRPVSRLGGRRPVRHGVGRPTLHHGPPQRHGAAADSPSGASTNGTSVLVSARPFRLISSSRAPRTNCFRMAAASTRNSGRPPSVGLNSWTSLNCSLPPG